MRRAIVRCAILSCLCCGGGTTSGSPPTIELDSPAADFPAATLDIEGREPNADEAADVERLFRAAEATRGLRLLRAVEVRIQTEEMITRHLSREIDEEQLERNKEMYVALGLLDPSTNIRELLLQVLGEQVLGYYDIERNFLAVRQDVMRELGRVRSTERAEARAVLVHEIVHALQDQHLPIPDDAEGGLDTDATNALQALLEGDASLAMVGYLAHAGGVSLQTLTANPAVFSRMIDQSPPVLGDELTRAPAIVRIPLLAAYLAGMRFAAELHRTGGWREVNAAFARFPGSTEAILHPDVYRSGEPIGRVVLPPILELESAGLTAGHEDTLGELELSVYLGQDREGDVDRTAAAGWNGDRLRVYRSTNGRVAIVWLTRWDTDEDARQAEEAARRVGTPIVRRQHRDVLLARGVPDALAPAVEGILSPIQAPSNTGAPL